jgi:hypothetical protein
MPLQTPCYRARCSVRCCGRCIVCHDVYFLVDVHHSRIAVLPTTSNAACLFCSQRSTWLSFFSMANTSALGPYPIVPLLVPAATSLVAPEPGSSHRCFGGTQSTRSVLSSRFPPKRQRRALWGSTQSDASSTRDCTRNAREKRQIPLQSQLLSTTAACACLVTLIVRPFSSLAPCARQLHSLSSHTHFARALCSLQ